MNSTYILCLHVLLIVEANVLNKRKTLKERRNVNFVIKYCSLLKVLYSERKGVFLTSAVDGYIFQQALLRNLALAQMNINEIIS